MPSSPISPAFVAPQPLKRLFEPGITVLASNVDDYCEQLMPEERALLARAVDKRRREFSTGRILARAGLEQFAVRDFALKRGKHNEPLWPDGLSGSISHSSSWCVVALGQASKFQGIGVDIEHDSAKVANLEAMILRSDEQREMRKFGGSELDFLRLSFSAKEAVYKAIFYDVGRFVDFDEVSLVFNNEDLSFRACAPDDSALSAMLEPGNGKCAFLNGHIVSSFVRLRCEKDS